MLSFNSLLFTIFAVIAIWKGFSLLQRFSDQRQGSSTPAKQPGQVSIRGQIGDQVDRACAVHTLRRLCRPQTRLQVHLIERLT